MVMLLTLGAGAGDLSQLLMQMQPPASTSLLHPPMYAPGARRGCLCQHLGGRGSDSREGWDQGQDWRMLRGVTAPQNGQEGGKDVGSQLRSQGGWEEDLQCQC